MKTCNIETPSDVSRLRVVHEEDMDAEPENGQELLLEEIKNDKMYVYDYIPDKLYLAECHTMLGTINFSLVIAGCRFKTV